MCMEENNLKILLALYIHLEFRRQYSTWFIVVLNTELKPHLVFSEIIAIAEPWVSLSVIYYRVIANKTIGFV